MKNNKLLASLKRAIQAQEMIMDGVNQFRSAPEQSSPYLIKLLNNGSEEIVELKSIDFREGQVKAISIGKCPLTHCKPAETSGRCCIFDPSAGWGCQEVATSVDCAALNGIFEPNKKCSDEPACGNFEVMGVDQIEETKSM